MNALIVIDMQNDYLYEKRKSMFPYDTAALVGAVNTLIHQYNDAGDDVIYIRHLIQNLPTNKLLFGFSLAGTEGAELFSGLDVVSDYCFDKYFGDALTNGQLLRLVQSRQYGALHLFGLDEYGCVTETAVGAARRSLNAAILRSGTATVLPQKKIDKARKKQEKFGVTYL